MKVLILGDGLLGSELHSQTGWNIASRKLGNLDINDWVGLANLISPYNAVVNCIAHTDSYSEDKEIHYNVNYRFPADLSDICNRERVKLVHISTEFVYANNENPPTEDELPLPDNTWYAYTKLLADEYIQLNSKSYLICRELHKPNPFPYSNVWNVQTSGDTVDKIASIIVKLIDKNINGVVNVGTGDKYLSEIAPNSEVVNPPSGIPTDTRMDLSKLKSIL